MVYTMLTLSFVVMAALAILGLVFNAVALTVVMLGIMLVYALVLFCFRKKIKIGIVLVKVASKFIMEKPSIFIAPVLNIIFMFAIAYFWIYSAGAMIAVINNNNTYNKSSTV